MIAQRIIRVAALTTAALTLAITITQCSPAIAAEAGAAAASAAPAATQSAPALSNAWLILIPALVPIIIAVIKLLLPRLPKVWLPILAPLLGAATEWLLSGQFSQGTLLGAIAGAAGVGLREIVDQVKKLAAEPANPTAR
jgi:hypothetical protein